MQETITLADWISVLINFLLLVVTISTVIYASKTLLMEHSSQVIVSRVSSRSSIEEEYPHQWELELKNVGKGYIVKAFMLLSMKSKRGWISRQYFLSKPVIGILPDESCKISISLKDKYMDKTNRNSKQKKIEVLYQDSLNNLYKVEPGFFQQKGFNIHLEQLDKLPKKLSKFCFSYWNYQRKISKSKKQDNTAPRIFKAELIEKDNEMQEAFNELRNSHKKGVK